MIPTPIQGPGTKSPSQLLVRLLSPVTPSNFPKRHVPLWLSFDPLRPAPVYVTYESDQSAPTTYVWIIVEPNRTTIAEVAHYHLHISYTITWRLIAKVIKIF
jgi:hypothetical protein